MQRRRGAWAALECSREECSRGAGKGGRNSFDWPQESTWSRQVLVILLVSSVSCAASSVRVPREFNTNTLVYRT